MSAPLARGGAFAAVRTSLVVLAPNNSGSTVLREAIAASSGCWHLPREAQHIAGFAGPSTRSTGTRLIWAATPDRLAGVCDPALHDWPRSWLAWMAAAKTEDPVSPVIVLSSPPFMFLADTLARALPDPRFVLIVRDPYAIAAGILARRDQQTTADGEDIRVLAAGHVVACLERQRENAAALGKRGVLLRYEDICADPAAAEDTLLALVPELGRIALGEPVSVKGIYHEPLRDMNRASIARLLPGDREILERSFANYSELLSTFSYGSSP
jgi:hypothetical protein